MSNPLSSLRDPGPMRELAYVALIEQKDKQIEELQNALKTLRADVYSLAAQLQNMAVGDRETQLEIKEQLFALGAGRR